MNERNFQSCSHSCAPCSIPKTERVNVLQDNWEAVNKTIINHVLSMCLPVSSHTKFNKPAATKEFHLTVTQKITHISMKFANICIASDLFLCGYCKNHYFDDIEELIRHEFNCPCYGPHHVIPVSLYKCKGPCCGYITYSVPEMFRHRDRDQGCAFQSAPDKVRSVGIEIDTIQKKSPVAALYLTNN